MKSHTIIVGYDGSNASRAALEVAKRRAEPDGTVVVIYAYDAPSSWLGTPYYDTALQSHLAAAREVLGHLELDESGTVTWETDLVQGSPAHVIAAAAEARGADEIVLGTRGHGTARALMGSTAHELVHLATCPVTVIPERAVAKIAAMEPAAAAGA